jgi:hydroxymethylpyrimidine pyrophosphatase-like HAD family hydrolase
VAGLRAAGLRFVIITGARLSTLLMRLPYLPAADAFVCESGGRIFYPGNALATGNPRLQAIIGTLGNKPIWQVQAILESMRAVV